MQRETCLRREVAGVLPPLLVRAPRDAEIHEPVRNLGDGRVSAGRHPPLQPPPCPAPARSLPRPTAGTGASCWPWCTPAGPWRHSTCTGRWADPCAGQQGRGDARERGERSPRPGPWDGCISGGVRGRKQDGPRAATATGGPHITRGPGANQPQPGHPPEGPHTSFSRDVGHCVPKRR